MVTAIYYVHILFYLQLNNISIVLYIFFMSNKYILKGEVCEIVTGL